LRGLMAPCARVKDAEVGAQPAFLRIAATGRPI